MQDLKILQVCIFGIDVELHSGHWDIEINAVKYLAESCSVSQASACWQGVMGRGLVRGREQTYPVPHCSTLVMFSCSRPFSQASSSCLHCHVSDICATAQRCLARVPSLVGASPGFTHCDAQKWCACSISQACWISRYRRLNSPMHSAFGKAATECS